MAKRTVDGRVKRNRPKRAAGTEELLQTAPVPLGRYAYYRLGATTLGALSRARIISAHVPDEVALNRPDGLILDTTSGVVKAYVEYKPPSKLRTKKQVAQAIEQEVAPAKALCKVLAVSDGQQTHWINTLTENPISTAEEGGLPVLDVGRIMRGEATGEELSRLETLLDLIDLSISDTNDTLVPPVLQDPSQLAKTIWQKIWINTGKDPEKCLYNVVELFVFKFLSDLGVLSFQHSFTSVYAIHKQKTDREALEYYAQLCRPQIHRLFPPADDGTTIINGTIFVNEMGHANLAQARLFGEILDELQEYADTHGSFRYIQREFKTRLYESFLRQEAKVRFLGQYLTPRNVVRAMVEMSPLSSLAPGARICDPFCGVGGFILEAIANTPHIYEEFEPQNGKVVTQTTLVGYDKGTDEKEDERTIILAKANMLIYFSELLAQYNTPEYLQQFAEGAFNKVFRLVRTNLGTFERVNDDPYDVILTNPPYVTSGSRSIREAIDEAGLSQHYSAGGRGTEALALEWVVRNLKPGGTALVIVPDGLMRQAAMLSFVKRECLVRGIISLPVRTFYSTDKKTYILILERKRRVEVQVDPVFTYLVSEIGETRDARRWPTDRNDLTEAVALYGQFRGMPGTFSSTQPRCRVLPFAEVQSSTHWMVDRWWSDQELRELGVGVEPALITDEELHETVGEIQSTLQDFGGMTVPDGPYRFKEIGLDDPSVFRLTIGRRVVKRAMSGEGIPVYSAGLVERPFGYTTNPPAWARYGPALVWGIDGNFDWGFVPDGEQFVPTDHCGVLEVLDESLLLRYVYHELNQTKGEYGFDRVYRSGIENVCAAVTIRVPVKEDGSFDLEAQRLIAARFDAVQALQTKLASQLATLSQAQYEWPYLSENVGDEGLEAEPEVGCFAPIKPTEG